MLINCEILIVLGRVLFFAEKPFQHAFQKQLNLVDNFQFILENKYSRKIFSFEIVNSFYVVILKWTVLVD